MSEKASAAESHLLESSTPAATSSATACDAVARNRLLSAANACAAQRAAVAVCTESVEKERASERAKGESAATKQRGNAVARPRDPTPIVHANDAQQTAGATHHHHHNETDDETDDDAKAASRAKGAMTLVYSALNIECDQ